MRSRSKVWTYTVEPYQFFRLSTFGYAFLEMLELEGISKCPVQPFTGHQFSHLRMSESSLSYILIFKTSEPWTQSNSTTPRWQRERVARGHRGKTITQLRTKPNSLGTAGSRDGAVMRYHANPQVRKRQSSGVASLLECGLPASLLLPMTFGPTARVAEAAGQAQKEKPRKWRGTAMRWWFLLGHIERYL